MTVTSVSTSTFIKDATIIIRDELLNNVTDPISSSRPSGETFVLTSYPHRDVSYPIITLQNTNLLTQRLGMQSEIHRVQFTLEIRVWARSVSQRDNLAQDVINQLRDFEFDADGSVFGKMFGFTLNSAVNVDEPGEGGLHSKVMEVEYSLIVGDS